MFGKRTRLVFLGLMVCTAMIAADCAVAPAAFEPTPCAVLPTQFALELPDPVYYLIRGQIWRLERDGDTENQITFESAAVVSFDISQKDGALVYVSGNSLIQTDAWGGSRQVLLAGPELPAATDDLARLNDRQYILGQIASPVWSPDGEHIAFIQNGLNMYTSASGEVQSSHPNDTIPQDGQANGRLVIDSVISWSPDGKHLLLRVYRYPLQSVYHQQPALKTLSGNLTFFWDCYGCDFGWSQDSKAFYLANPLFGGSDALSRCTTEEGRCTPIGQDVPARTAFFYSQPYHAGTEGVYVFMATSPDIGQPPRTFGLFRLGVDGSGIRSLRSEEYALQETLWAQDGQGVIIVTGKGADETPAGALLWLGIDGSPAVCLPVSGAGSLTWGQDG